MNKADNDNDNDDNYDACPHVHRSEFMDVLERMRSSKSRDYDETGEAVPPWKVDVGKHSL